MCGKMHINNLPSLKKASPCEKPFCCLYKRVMFIDLKQIITCGIIHISKVSYEVNNLKISTKGRYALRMMLDLAEHKSDGYISLKDIAERQNISKKYLEQIVPLLNKSGVLRTTRGFQGGYMLAKDADKYTVLDILKITEGSMAPVACLDDETNLCERNDECITLNVWKGLYEVINKYLNSITLQDILDKNRNLAIDEYYI